MDPERALALILSVASISLASAHGRYGTSRSVYSRSAWHISPAALDEGRNPTVELSRMGEGLSTVRVRRGLYRSSGCFGSEVGLQCPRDIDATIVVENATFYHIPFFAINCSQGRLGPLAVEGDSASADTLVRSTFFPKERPTYCAYHPAATQLRYSVAVYADILA